METTMTTRTSEYHSIPATDPWSMETLIAERPSKLLPNRLVRFVEISAGWVIAGSAARWQEACWGVRFNENGCLHGRQFANAGDAESTFKAWTNWQSNH
jgi:hypothetical protein